MVYYTERHVKLLTAFMKKAGTNLFQSHRTRARKVLELLTDNGFQLIQTKILAEKEREISSLKASLQNAHETANALRASLQASGTTPASRSDKARALYTAGKFTELAVLKRNAKVSYAALGFSMPEIQRIQLALGSN